MGFGLLRRLEHLRDACEPPVVQQEPERREAEEAGTDVLVAVEPGPEVGLRVVQVERQHAAKADGPLAFRHRALPALAPPDVVAGGEQVARVEADPDALGTPHARHQRTELGQSAADDVPGAGRVLERDLHPVQGRGDARDARVEPVAHVRARVDHDRGEPERLGAIELVGERVDRLPPLRRPGRGEVHEVARVREHRPHPGAPPGRPERADVVGRERTRRPLPVALEEDLDRVASERVATVQRERETARDRHVSAEQVG
jgi:hypothetical protein